MKARQYPVVLSLFLGLVFSSSLRAAEADSAHAFVDPADPAVLEIRRLGERAIDQAGTALVLEVRRVLATTTPAMAIGVFHLKDYKLPAAAAGKSAVTELSRISLQMRNPAHAPDAAERAALDLIKEQLAQGDDVAKVLVQRVTSPGRPVEWRVYRPLSVMKECMACHGPAESLAPGVQDALKVFFPHDTAVNYNLGGWRGLMRVTIVPAPAVKL